MAPVRIEMIGKEMAVREAAHLTVELLRVARAVQVAHPD
jgi:hypothetical protein